MEVGLERWGREGCWRRYIDSKYWRGEKWEGCGIELGREVEM